MFSAAFLIIKRTSPANNSSDSYFHKEDKPNYIYQMNAMIPNNSAVERLIVDYIEQQQKSLYHHKKKTDAEKEYNKLLTICGGEEKNFSLDEADRIYKAYQEILVNEEQSSLAESKFSECYEKLKELGRVLFYANITADIIVPPVNGGLATQKKITVSFPNGEVFVA